MVYVYYDQIKDRLIVGNCTDVTDARIHLRDKYKGKFKPNYLIVVDNMLRSEMIDVIKMTAADS